MKFLVDAQLPKSLAVVLTELGNDSVHTLDLPERNFSTDHVITKYCLVENRVLITKDSDFLDSFLLKKEPEKLIIVRTGNINNNDLLDIFKNNIIKIRELLDTGHLVEISKENIVLHT